MEEEKVKVAGLKWSVEKVRVEERVRQMQGAKYDQEEGGKKRQ